MRGVLRGGTKKKEASLGEKGSDTNQKNFQKGGGSRPCATESKEVVYRMEGRRGQQL